MRLIVFAFVGLAACSGGGKDELTAPDLVTTPTTLSTMSETSSTTDVTSTTSETTTTDTTLTDTTIGDPAGDADGDGLSNAEEAVLGTDPLLADTDADGLDDR